MTEKKKKEADGTDEPLRPFHGNPRDQPILQGWTDPVRQREINQVVGSLPVKVTTVVGTPVGTESSVEHGVIPGAAEDVPKPDMVPQKKGGSTVKPVTEPEQER